MNFFSKKKQFYNRDETKAVGMGSLMQILMNKKKCSCFIRSVAFVFFKGWVCIFGSKTQALSQNKKNWNSLNFDIQSKSGKILRPKWILKIEAFD